MLPKTYDQWKTTEPEWLDEIDEACSCCGGNGYLDECECGEDTCCCLEPTPIVCPECDGNG